MIPSIRLLEHAGAGFSALSRRREWLVLALLLAMVGTASAQIIQAVPGTQRALCTDFPNPVANATWCADGNNGPNYTWKVWDGTQYITITGGGGGGGNVSGSGITNFLPVWTNGPSSIIGNSILQQGTNLLVINPGSGSSQTFETSSAGTVGAPLVVKAGDALGGGGGTLTLKGGTATVGGGGGVEIDGQPGAPGGHVAILAGTSTSGAGGFISLAGGQSPSTGGTVFVSGGGSTGAAGGLIQITGGAGTGAAGGAVTIAGGTGTSTGAVKIQGLTYPAVDGTNGQVITTNGAGVLTFSNAGAGSITGSGTTNTLSKFTGSTAIGNSTITDDGTTATLGSTNVKLANQVAASGHTCLQVDTAGVITQTGLPCASGFSGTVTISGSNTTGAVVFSSTQPDTTYTVTLGTRSSAGTPPAVVADYKSKATTGFTVEISAPPGGGNSIDVDWQIGSGNFTTGGGGVTGSGTTGTIPLWTGSTSLGNSHLTDNGTLITSSENIVPSADQTKDLGSTTVAWQTIFAKGNAGISDNKSAIVLGSAPANVSTNGSKNGLLTLQTKFYTFGIADLMLNDGDGPLAFLRSNGTYASPTAVTNGADSGTILFSEWNGSNFVTAASIQGVSAVASGPAYGGRLTITTSITSGGSNIWTLDEFGRVQQATSTFANLTAGTPANGMFAYCSDCDPPAAFNATCSSSGTKTGAWAVRIHATWFCVAG